MDIPPLTAQKDDVGNIVLRLSGDLTEDKLETLTAGIRAAEALIQDVSKETGTRVRVLLDMTAFTGNYAVQAVEAMTSFAKTNTAFIFKTAAFGSTSAAGLVTESVAALANRENIQFFESEAKAREWLAF